MHISGCRIFSMLERALSEFGKVFNWLRSVCNICLRVKGQSFPRLFRRFRLGNWPHVRCMLNIVNRIFTLFSKRMSISSMIFRTATSVSISGRGSVPYKRSTQGVGDSVRLHKSVFFICIFAFLASLLSGFDSSPKIVVKLEALETPTVRSKICIIASPFTLPYTLSESKQWLLSPDALGE